MWGSYFIAILFKVSINADDKLSCNATLHYLITNHVPMLKEDVNKILRELYNAFVEYPVDVPDIPNWRWKHYELEDFSWASEYASNLVEIGICILFTAKEAEIFCKIAVKNTPIVVISFEAVDYPQEPAEDFFSIQMLEQLATIVITTGAAIEKLYNIDSKALTNLLAAAKQNLN